jgi:hypothetical protein
MMLRLNKLERFRMEKYFQPSLIFSSEAGTYREWRTHRDHSINIEIVGVIKYCIDFTTQWVQQIFMILIKISITYYLKHTSFWSSADDKLK